MIQPYQRSVATFFFPYLMLCLAMFGSWQPVVAADDEAAAAQRAKDARIVQTLLRLPNVDLKAKPELKETLLRYLETVKGTEKYLQLVEKYGLADTRDELLRLAIDDADGTQGAAAARLLLNFDEREFLTKALAHADDMRVTKLLQSLGLAGETKANDLLLPLVTDDKRSVTVRNSATRAVGRSLPGQKALLKLVEQEKLATELHFAAANALLGSPDVTVREAASKHLKLPATAGSEPLPPLPELVKLSGDGGRGQKIFQTTGTCAKCHKVRGEGKDVGPDLSEIGSKLSREALFVSILDPSAGVAHSFETYVVITDDGNVITGLLVSDSAEAVTIKTAEAIVRVIPKSNVEEFQKQKVSLMPADLQKLMSKQELVDVVDYIATLKKP